MYCIDFDFISNSVSDQMIKGPAEAVMHTTLCGTCGRTVYYSTLYHGRKIMTNQRTGNASIIFHNHPLCLPTVLYVGSVPVNEHRLVRVGHFTHHRPCYKLVKELTAQRLWDINHSSATRSRGLYPIIVS